MAIDRTLAEELAAMVAEDQRMRKQLMKHDGNGGFPTVEQSMAMSRIDVANTDRLREIVDEHGWPGRSLVGRRGAHDAWLLAQHADRQLDFQRRVLGLLEEAVAAGEAEARDLAYLTDRVRKSEGREQLYGTQMIGGTGEEVTPWPIEDAANVDARRAAVGLDSHAEYTKGFTGRQRAKKA